MQILLRCNAKVIRRWHVSLLQRLAVQPGHRVAVELVEGQPDVPPGVQALFQLEATIHGLPGYGQTERIAAGELLAAAVPNDQPADLVLDLCGNAKADRGRVWLLTFNGIAGENGLLGAIFSGATPCVQVLDTGTIVAEGRLGTEYGGVALASFDDMLARTVVLVAAAVAGGARTPLPGLPCEADHSAPGVLSPGKLGQAAVKKITRRAIQQIYRLCYNSPHWRTGWRKIDGADLFDLREHPQGGWHDLPDDGRRFYADPFPVVHDGKVILFVEDFEHRLGKGIISAVEFAEGKPAGVPRPVLELGCHLSYPFVFEEEGEWWMIPETSGHGTIELHRATAFPDGWVKEADLVTGMVCSDATLIRQGGLWWMFATVRDGGGAFSDALHLWSAPDFRGPWTPHEQNPVLIDIASARPAGRMVERNGSLLRPVQDCRRGYGASLGIARVDRLDAGGYAQTVETIIRPGGLWPGRRLHSLNSAGGYEFIDGSGTAPKWGFIPG